MPDIAAYKNMYYDTMMNNFVPFWMEFSLDHEFGGYLCGFDRDGELIYTDKPVWHQGRSLWMYSKLYNEFGKKQEWLDAAKLGYDFINEHCFDEKGHMYFRVTREGKPLVNRRYYFSEAFAIMGYCEYYLATGNEEVRERAIKLFEKFHYYYTTPGVFPPKVNPETRQLRGHSIVMIMLNVCQHMRRIDDKPLYDELITNSINTITNLFVHEDKKVLLETVGPNGEFVDSPDGRTINPGHSMETAWFIMTEAIHRKDAALMKKAMDITLWSLERGWDKEKGGVFYFLDVNNKPVLKLEWDMKLLWVHCEGMIALLYSYLYTGEKIYMDWFEKITKYVFEHYPDEGHPEWFAHLHRDGTTLNYAKGHDWKSPYHNVRAFMIISQLLEKIEKGEKLEF